MAFGAGIVAAAVGRACCDFVVADADIVAVVGVAHG